MRVTPDLVSVWYFSPFDSNSMTCGRAGTAQSNKARPHAPASRCITLYYDAFKPGTSISLAWTMLLYSFRKDSNATILLSAGSGDRHVRAIRVGSTNRPQGAQDGEGRGRRWLGLHLCRRRRTPAVHSTSRNGRGGGRTDP